MWYVGQIPGTTHRNGQIKVNVDMDSLMAQASCAERKLVIIQMCKVKVWYAQRRFLFFFLVKALWSFSHRL